MNNEMECWAVKRRQLIKKSLCVPLFSFLPVISAWAQEGNGRTLWLPPKLASLGYDMSGHWATDVTGSGYLDWKYDEASSVYSMQLSVSALLMTLRYSSMGFIDKSEGMLPTRFREKRTKRDERIVHIDQVQNKVSYGWKEGVDEKPQGIQDVTSIMLQFGFLLSTSPEKARVGQVFNFPVARMGSIKHWDFRIEGDEITKTRVGSYKTWHIKRLKEEDGKDSDLQVEFWLAPELRYMPQKIHFNMKNDSYLHVSLNKVKALE